MFTIRIPGRVCFFTPANCHQPETRAVGHPCNPFYTRSTINSFFHSWTYFTLWTGEQCVILLPDWRPFFLWSCKVLSRCYNSCKSLPYMLLHTCTSLVPLWNHGLENSHSHNARYRVRLEIKRQGNWSRAKGRKKRVETILSIIYVFLVMALLKSYDGAPK
jgi:hypothetical protein